MASLVFVDLETGGTRPETHSLLTVGLVTLDTKTLELTRPVLVAVKHDLYHVNAEAMAVNGLDLVRHHEGAVPPEQAANEVRDYLRFKRKGRVMLGGHNVAFDVRFLKSLLPDYSELVLGGVVDTKSTAQFLIHAGKLPKTLNTRLEDLANFFGVEIRPHDALSDATASAGVYARMLALLRD